MMSGPPTCATTRCFTLSGGSAFVPPILPARPPKPWACAWASEADLARGEETRRRWATVGCAWEDDGGVRSHRRVLRVPRGYGLVRLRCPFHPWVGEDANPPPPLGATLPSSLLRLSLSAPPSHRTGPRWRRAYDARRSGDERTCSPTESAPRVAEGHDDLLHPSNTPKNEGFVPTTVRTRTKSLT